MADPVTATAVAGTGLKAIGSLVGGANAKAQANAEAANYEARRQGLALQNLQTNEQKLEEYAAALQTVEALRGSRNVGFYSPTAIAFDKALDRRARAERLKSRLGFEMESDVMRRNAISARRSGKIAMLGGVIGAGGELLNGFNFGGSSSSAASRGG